MVRDATAQVEPAATLGDLSRVQVTGGKDWAGALMLPYEGSVMRFPGSIGEARGEVYVIADSGGGYWVSLDCVREVTP